jgi:hypothetical protein
MLYRQRRSSSRYGCHLHPALAFIHSLLRRLIRQSTIAAGQSVSDALRGVLGRKRFMTLAIGLEMPVEIM